MIIKAYLTVEQAIQFRKFALDNALDFGRIEVMPTLEDFEEELKREEVSKDGNNNPKTN